MIMRILIAVILASAAAAQAEVAVTTVDFLDAVGVSINAAGPLLIRMDEERDRLIVANTLTSSLSLVDCKTRAVRNVPLGGRALQHLKSEAMTVRRATGEIYLLGSGCLFIVDPERGSARTIRTDAQFESVAVDESTGNVFVAGRESPSLGFVPAGAGKVTPRPWLDRSERLINLNQTPPPPIRKVVADAELGRVMAVDGYTATIRIFDAKKATPVSSRTLPLTQGGRWHLAGYSEERHALYLVTETDQRRVIEAARIDCTGEEDVVVPLPEFTEGVGITYNPEREEIYIPYDNHPSVHVVSFADGGEVDEIAIPAYGNDASAVDTSNGLLYVTSWAFGEIDVVSLDSRSLIGRFTGLGIIPHMFTVAFNPRENVIYFPKGATAVNGTFGAALTLFDPEHGTVEKLALGWAPIDLIELRRRGTVLVFGSEDQFAEVHPDGRFELHTLPYDYPVGAAYSPEGNVYLSYGPHQSYWPAVYIWGAKDGILTIDAETLGFYDRRVPRQAQQMALDRDGVLYFTQNNWGKEEEFLGVLGDEVRLFDAGKRFPLGAEVEREVTQRILRYDPECRLLYLVRVGERDEDPSVLQVIDPAGRSVIRTIPVGRTATDCTFDERNIYVANFDSRSVSVIDKESFSATEVAAGDLPLRLCRWRDRIYVADHGDNTLQEVTGSGRRHRIPQRGLPDNVFPWGDGIVLTSYSPDGLSIVRFDPESGSFTPIHREKYPYGETRYDSRNVSFYVRGQYGDAVFALTRGAVDGAGRLWITDFIRGAVYILSDH